MSNGSLSSSTPVIRLCQIIQWKDFDGYGFNLHAEKGKPGQYIGKVDERSPAEAAGLQQGDRIIEVNGVNIANENHKQVVQRIKAIPEETKLLVVDSENDKYFKSNNIVIKSSLQYVVCLKTPPLRPQSAESGIGLNTSADKELMNSEDSRSNKSEKSSKSFDAEGNNYAESNNSNTTTPSSGRKHGSSPEPHLDSADEAIPSPSLRDPPADHGSNYALNRNDLNSNLNLNMTAKELRAKLASRKKYDPKKQSMDFKEKFDIVQKL